MQTDTHTLDAAGKKLGRVATEAATILMGKHDPHFERHQEAVSQVHIVNASKLHLPEKKRVGKMYARYSGYPSGLKKETLAMVSKKHGYREVVRKAIYGMLPSNKLRARAMRRLTVEE